MNDNQTYEKLIKLGLKGMLRSLERQELQVDAHKLSFMERLGIIVDSEINDREHRRIERLKKAAKMRQPSACLEDIDYKPTRNLDQSLIMSLAGCDWIKRNQNVIITGPTGTGKSWLACALGIQACRANYSVYYTTATQLFEDLSSARIENTLPKIRRLLIKTELLILDDLGLGGIDTDLGPILLDIIDHQSQRGALLITSQYPTSKWYDFFNDATVADAILDRIIHHAHNLQLKGESMRKTKKK